MRVAQARHSKDVSAETARRHSSTCFQIQSRDDVLGATPVCRESNALLSSITGAVVLMSGSSCIFFCSTALDVVGPVTVNHPHSCNNMLLSVAQSCTAFLLPYKLNFEQPLPYSSPGSRSHNVISNSRVSGGIDVQMILWRDPQSSSNGDTIAYLLTDTDTNNPKRQVLAMTSEEVVSSGSAISSS